MVGKRRPKARVKKNAPRTPPRSSVSLRCGCGISFKPRIPAVYPSPRPLSRCIALMYASTASERGAVTRSWGSGPPRDDTWVVSLNMRVTLKCSSEESVKSNPLMKSSICWSWSENLSQVPAYIRRLIPSRFSTNAGRVSMHSSSMPERFAILRRKHSPSANAEQLAERTASDPLAVPLYCQCDSYSSLCSSACFCFSCFRPSFVSHSFLEITCRLFHQWAGSGTMAVSKKALCCGQLGVANLREGMDHVSVTDTPGMQTVVDHAVGMGVQENVSGMRTATPAITPVGNAIIGATSFETASHRHAHGISRPLMYDCTSSKLSQLRSVISCSRLFV
mmetsp:Transcript_4174/g.9975  ORF Transcript_4174/g.9975 Transcript_4174/m.9975 type:complete len:335 (-) Transcript_4174:2377-3381(-)